MTNNYNARLLEILFRQAEEKRVSHAYLFSGQSREILKEMAQTFAQKLVSSPADILFPQHEKPNFFGVDDVRREINETVAIRPYGDGRKVYIVEEAEKMNPAAQNALLKTLEEPPAYVVIILLSLNTEVFLDTILSRVVRISVLTEEEADEKDQRETEIRTGVRNLLEALRNQNYQEEKKLIGDLLLHKERLNDELEEFRSWFRDILLYKAARPAAPLVHSGDSVLIGKYAMKMSYEGIEKVLTCITEAQSRLQMNVNAEPVLDIVLYAIQEAY